MIETGMIGGICHAIHRYAKKIILNTGKNHRILSIGM